jgi:C4-dicarboxylate-specific signal transduction histidine kinase
MKVLSVLQRYGLAVVSCGVALAIAWPIDAPASCFLLAVAVSSLFGGLGPGLLSIGLSAAAFNYLFLRRTSPPAVEPAVFFRFVVFLLATLLIALLIEIKRRVEDSGKRAEQALRQANLDLARVSRVTTMGELTAALAHEVNQPIAASITDANTCLRWLMRDPPDLAEAREAASRTIKDVTRAAEIIRRVRQLFKKDTLHHELLDINEIIRETALLLHGGATQHGIIVRTDLARMLPRVMGDRVQLQQVLMNLMMNSIDAMKSVEGTRQLTIQSGSEDDEVLISVSDTGVGLPPQYAHQIFNAFFTTKPQGTGMGLRISRSILESHRGRLWAAANHPCGATFHLALPTKVEVHE